MKFRRVRISIRLRRKFTMRAKSRTFPKPTYASRTLWYSAPDLRSVFLNVAIPRCASFPPSPYPPKSRPAKSKSFSLLSNGVRRSPGRRISAPGWSGTASQWIHRAAARGNIRRKKKKKKKESRTAWQCSARQRRVGWWSPTRWRLTTRSST